MPSASPDYTEHYVTIQDGLSLYYREYGAQHTTTIPILCLHGLTRNARDFEDIACHLGKTHRVIVPDMRGRGKSGYDPDYKNYQIPTYIGDVLDLLTAAGIHKIIIIGTSMGGLIAMGLAITRPTILAGVILNDVGPEIDPAGLARIAQYAGNMKPVKSWEDAARQTMELNATVFPEFGPADWMAFARRTFREGPDGIPLPDYDPHIGTAMRESTEAVAPEHLWVMFTALSCAPLLAFRGELSDILSSSTFEKMQKKIPAMKAVIVKNRGHAPLLNEVPCKQAIDNFVQDINGQ